MLDVGAGLEEQNSVSGVSKFHWTAQRILPPLAVPTDVGKSPARRGFCFDRSCRPYRSAGSVTIADRAAFQKDVDPYGSPRTTSYSNDEIFAPHPQ
jgi:hypothetical protein